MIYNIKGSSGCGKTVLARKIMDLYGEKTTYKDPTMPKRRRPIGYAFEHPRPGHRPLAVVGHYESACGGCDTISGMEKIFELVRQSHDAGMDVLFEGRILSEDVKRLLKLHEDGYPLTVVQLDIPLQDCYDSIMKRREGSTRATKPLSMPNTERNWKVVRRAADRVREAGIKVVSGDRDFCFTYLFEELFP